MNIKRVIIDNRGPDGWKTQISYVTDEGEEREHFYALEEIPKELVSEFLSYLEMQKMNRLLQSLEMQKNASTTKKL
jgi:IS1 family transposase